MNNEAVILSAIQNGRAWLDNFNHRDYPSAFHKYMNTFQMPFRAAIRDCDEKYEPFIGELLDILAIGWKREWFYKRTARRFDEKQMLLIYLSPMLLEIGEERFARELCSAWCARWPNDIYKITTYKKLQKSFRLTFMGFEIPRREEDEEDED